MGNFNKFFAEIRRLRSQLFSDENASESERMVMSDQEQAAKVKRWTWQLLGSNLAVVCGTAFMSGFIFPAFVRFSALSPHNTADISSISTTTQSYSSNRINNIENNQNRRRYLNGSFDGTQMFCFHIAKTIAFLGIASVVGNKFGRSKALLAGAAIGMFAIFLGLLSAYLPSPDMTADYWKRPISASDIVFTFTAALLGFQSGLGQVVAPAYLIEMAPNTLRGACGVFYEVAFWLGFVTSFNIEIDGLFDTERELWHLLIGCAFTVYAVHFGVMWFTIESPRWLIHEKRDVEAKAVLQNLRQCSKDEAEAELNDIKFVNERIGSASFSGSQPGCCDKCCCGSTLFTSKVMWPVFVGSCLMTANYLTGGPIVFQLQSSVWKYDSPIMLSKRSENDFLPATVAVITILYLAVMAFCAFTVDGIGRRRLVIYGLGIMAIFYLPVSIGVYLKIPTLWQIGSVFLMAGYSLGPGPIATFMVGEFFDQSTRLSATSICHLVTQIFPVIAVECYRFDAYEHLFLPGGILFSVVELVLLVLFLPETMRIPIEQVVQKFEPGRRRLQIPTRGAAEELATQRTSIDTTVAILGAEQAINYPADDDAVTI